MEVTRSQNTKHLVTLVILALYVWPDQNLPRNRQQHLIRPCLLHSFSRCFRVCSEKCLSASSCLSADINAAPTGRVFVKFDIGHFYENMSKNSRFS